MAFNSVHQLISISSLGPPSLLLLRTAGRRLLPSLACRLPDCCRPRPWLDLFPAGKLISFSENAHSPLRPALSCKDVRSVCMVMNHMKIVETFSGRLFWRVMANGKRVHLCLEITHCINTVWGGNLFRRFCNMVHSGWFITATVKLV